MICDRTASNTVSAAANGLSRVLARNNVISIIVFPEPRRVRVGKGRRFQGGANRRRGPMTTATDTFRQHLQETQAIHFLPYVGDGYADASPRILMIGEAARRRTEPTERTLTGSCAGRSKTPPKATATTGSATSATSPPCSPGTLTVGPTRCGIPWLTAYSSSTWKRKRTATGPAPRLKKSRSDAGRSLPCSTS